MHAKKLDIAEVNQPHVSFGRATETLRLAVHENLFRF
jgi:hypothetical protein